MNDSESRRLSPADGQPTGEPGREDWVGDAEFIKAFLPFFLFLYRAYWRVEANGVDHIPGEGRALLVSNHSGLLPWDGVMIGMAVLTEHPIPRLVHTLYGGILDRLPFASSVMARLGQVAATADNGAHLLEKEQLVAVFPEGYKGLGKTFRERYKLARFGRGGFARLALRTQSPIIPVAVVGAEESYVALSMLPSLSRLAGLPYLPVSLTGFVPLPTKWYIDFGDPVPTDRYGPAAENSLRIVSRLSDVVRDSIQEMIYRRLARRRSVFFG